MKGLIFTLALFFLILEINGNTKPKDDLQPPVWPNQFEQSFTETFSYYVVSGETSGNFYYDFTNRRYRVDRLNGKYDRYCGTIFKFTDTPCTHLVSGGNRYLYFPEKNYCCNCCNDAKGCGVLKPDWLSGAKFIDYEMDGNGRMLEKWDKPGLQSNFYYATHDENRIMTKIDQTPNDVQNFDPNSFYLGIRDPKVFDLPPQCTPDAKCGMFTICSLV